VKQGCGIQPIGYTVRMFREMIRSGISGPARNSTDQKKPNNEHPKQVIKSKGKKR
jgi:hypothetical protein